MQFKDTVVWITGASSGIGEGLTKAFAAAGARVVLSARRISTLKGVAAEAGLTADRCLILPLDLTRPESFPAAVQRVRRRFGHVDILVNNGGISQRALARETELPVVRRIFSVNVFGTIELTRQALSLMQGGSRIVVISSVVGRVGTPLRSSYAASKHALQGYFDSLRAELHSEGIGVTLILPGYVHTNVSVHALTGDGRAQGRMDDSVAAGMSADEFARRALPVIHHRKNEAVIAGPRERFAVLLSRFAPSLLARVIRGAKVT